MKFDTIEKRQEFALKYYPERNNEWAAFVLALADVAAPLEAQLASQQPHAPVNGLSVEQVMAAAESLHLMVPIDAFFDANGGHIRKQEYGKVLHGVMCKELRKRITEALSQQAGEPVSDVEPVEEAATLGVSEGLRAKIERVDGLLAARKSAAPLPDVERLVEVGNYMRSVLAEEVSALEVGDSETGQQQYGDPDAADTMMEAIARWDALQLNGTLDRAKSSLHKTHPTPVQLSRDYEALYEHLCNGGEAIGFLWWYHECDRNKSKWVCELRPREDGSISIVAPKFFFEDYDSRHKFIVGCQRLNLEWVAVRSSLPKNDGEPQQRQ